MDWEELYSSTGSEKRRSLKGAVRSVLKKSKMLVN